MLCLATNSIINAAGFTSDYNFISDGIYYKILTDSTVCVTYKNTGRVTNTSAITYNYNCTKPAGDVVIPSVVVYNDIEYNYT